MAIENYLLRLAIRNDFRRLKNELLGGHSYQERLRAFKRFQRKPEDIELVILALQKMIENDGFEKYELAIQLIDSIDDHLGVYKQRWCTLIDHVQYYLRLLHILSEIGQKATEDITKLMQRYFPDTRHDQKLESEISQAVYSKVRTYILQKLLQGRKSARFSKSKFPVKLDTVRSKLRKVFAKLRAELNVGLEPITISQFIDQSSEKEASDPAILLYYEMFGRNSDEIPTEDALLEFLKKIRESQASLQMPSAILLDTPILRETEDTISIPRMSQRTSKKSSFGSRTRSQSQSQTPKRKNQESIDQLNGSDDLFSSQPAPKRRRLILMDFDESFTSTSSSTDQNSVEVLPLDLKAEGIRKVVTTEGREIDAREFRTDQFLCAVRIEVMEELVRSFNSEDDLRGTDIIIN